MCFTLKIKQLNMDNDMVLVHQKEGKENKGLADHVFNLLFFII